MIEMNKSIKGVKNTEQEVFLSHHKEISRLNNLVLRFIIFISLGVFLLLFISSFILNKTINKLSVIYIIPLIMMTLLAFVFIKRKPHKIVLIGLYIAFTTFYFVTVYLSAIIFPHSLGASIVGLLLLIPFVIIDRTWRINTVTIIFYILFVISSFIYKNIDLAIDDMVTCGVFTVIGIFLGQYMRMIKLMNIINQDKFKKLSHTDALTHLYNRRKLENFMGSTDIEQQIIGAIMIDIDFFKQYNDTYGHQQGDKCLEEVGACLYRLAKYHHLKPFRYGGEEFIMTSTSHSYEKLYTIANDIKDEIAQLQFEFKESPYHVITISAGVSHIIESHTDDVYDLVDKADKALYHAKSNGRNLVAGYSYLKR